MVAPTFSINPSQWNRVSLTPMQKRSGFISRVLLVASLTVLGLLAVFVLPPLRQPQEYHRFADQRALLGVPNFLNVLSNVAFVLVGVEGLCFLARKRPARLSGVFMDPSEQWPYLVLFGGVLLTGLGSAPYHWRPCDSTLVWDRLPMTLVFTSLLAATVAERIHLKLGIRLLVPLALAGVASVCYWQRTGNLWPYAGVQFYSLCLIALMICLFPPRYNRTTDLVWAAGIYALAKVAEAFDTAILNALGFTSGHTLKHLLAAVAVLWLLRMLGRRMPESPEKPPATLRPQPGGCTTR